MPAILFVAGSTRFVHEAEAGTWAQEIVRTAMDAMGPGDALVTSCLPGPEQWAAETAKLRGVTRTHLRLHSGDRYDNDRFTKPWWEGWRGHDDWAFTTQRERNFYRNDTMVQYAEMARSRSHAVNFLAVTRDKYDFDLEYTSDLVIKATTSGFLVSEASYAARPLRPDIVWTDLETGGYSHEKNPILEIGAVRSDYTGCRILSTFETRVAVPKDMFVHPESAKVNGYNPFKWFNATPEAEAIRKFLDWLPKRFTYAGYNNSFDLRFLKHNIAVRQQLPLPGWIGFMDLMTKMNDFKKLSNKLDNAKLDTVCEYFGIYNKVRHRALADAERTRLVYLKIMGRIPESSILPTKDDVNGVVAP